MREHLNSREISAFVAGASNAAMDQHVRDCARCRLEAERLTGTLAIFRDSVRDWSAERETRVGVRPGHRKVPLRWLGWTAAATGCLIAGLTLPHEFSKPVPARQAVSAITDAELLSQVDRYLSEAVPPSMEPIALNQDRKRK